MDIQKEQRQAFEAWFETRYGANFMQFVILDGVYQDKHTQASWEAWQAAKDQAQADTKRIDFLADKSQSVANVMLPTKIVERNLSSLRDAIDQAMMIEVQDND